LPRDLEGLTRLWRAETADRRVLVVIDDAGSKRQLVPLLTSAPACLTVITSRLRSVMSVPHRSGIPQSGLNLPLDVLPLDDAVAMFTRIVGEAHIRGDDDVAELVELCGRLPLAIRLVAGWASSAGRAEWPYPSHWSIAELTENLRAGRRSLSEVHVGGQSLWDAFDISYRTLGESERRMFRRIGLHPTGEFSTDAAAAIGDLRTVEEAEPLLETLTDAGLLDVVEVGRYRMHVLLHEFAHERLDVEDASEERARAAGRLLDHYLHCALTAHRALIPYRPIDDQVSQTSVWAPDLDLGVPQAALAWFDRERETLLACQDLAITYRRTHAWRIPRAIGHYLTSRGHIGDAEAAYDEALRQAEEDWGGQAVADLTALSADVRYHQGSQTAAIELYRRARLRYVQLDDRLRAADMAVRIGICHRLTGATEQARTEFEQALDVFTDLGDQYGQLEARRGLEGVSGSAADPAAAVLRAPEVPEDARFCRYCRVPVGRGYGGRPGLLKGFCPQCGSAYSFTPELTPGDLVAGQYEAAGVVAHGGQGWVYLARDRNVGDRWVILKGLLDTDSAATADTIAERRFLAEIDHPNIARVLNFVRYPVPVTSAIRGYIVMEYVNGRSLFETLRQQRAEQGDSAALPLDYVLSCGIEILRALRYLHSRGLLYCDLKPENVIQSADKLKLIDLGAIRRMDDRDGPIYGTVSYQAPEVPAVGPTISSDLYTVGRTLAVLSLPFAFGFARTVSTPIKIASTPVRSTRTRTPGTRTGRDVSTPQSRPAEDTGAFAPRLPPREDAPLLTRYASYDQLLRRATHPDPSQRFRDADEMIKRLIAIRQEVAGDEHR
jgi:tetratricopeptide (TPR) repeat protein